MSEEIDQLHNIPLIKPKDGSAWARHHQRGPLPTRHEVWDHTIFGIRVISTVEVTDPKTRGPEWHLSISKYPGVYPEAWMEARVREDFSVQDFEKDDHGSKVMHLWLTVDKDRRGRCPCEVP